MTAIASAGLVAGCTHGGRGMLASGPKGAFGNGDETRDYIDGLGFTADTGYVASYSGATLLFLPRNRAQNVNWQADLQSQSPGDVVAQVMNISATTFTEGNFSLAQNEVAYAWVGEVKVNGATTRGFGIYKIDSRGFATGEWSVVATDKIKFCRNERSRSKPAIKNQHDGPPTDCSRIVGLDVSRRTRLASLVVSDAYAASTPSATAAFLGLGGLWISCSGGCCQISTM